MRILCIADDFIPEKYIIDGFAEFPELAENAVVRRWRHDSIEALQKDNLLVEQGGPDAVTRPEDVFEGIDEFDVIVTQFCPVPASIVEAATRLKVVGVLRGGTENVDSVAAKAHGVRIVNTPGRNAEAVAEFTLGMILAETRNLARSDASLRRGEWERDFPNNDEIPEVEGKHIGIVGLGAIGRRVASFVSAMGAEVAFFDPMVPSHESYHKDPDLAHLAATSDILCIHARLTPETHHLVSREVLSSMQRHAVLVNTARSGLVDEDALIEMLQERRIMGAAIDTFDTEPLPPDSPFLSLKNATITAHLAGSTADAFKKTPRILAPRLLEAIKEI